MYVHCPFTFIIQKKFSVIFGTLIFHPSLKDEGADMFTEMPFLLSVILHPHTYTNLELQDCQSIHSFI